MIPEPMEPLPDYAHTPLEALGIHVGPETGTPPPVRTPHDVLLWALEDQQVALRAVVEVLVREGLLTRGALETARQEILAEEAVDAEVGLVSRLLAEGLIEPLSATLARAERAQQPSCPHCEGGTPR